MNFPIDIINSQIEDCQIDFYDLPTEQIVSIAQQATQAAVEQLHQKGICTYGITDSVRRVSQRVANGGHDVPRQKIIDRYHRVMSLLPQAIRSVDRALLFDNSDELTGATLIAEFRDGREVYKVVDAPQWLVYE
jgi:predicted ABC-type ATPase